ncbi:PGR3 [Symbiodinium sp. CCMP2456]|nr:PGR3 [Symbiodinium sp. CCMP2456]
MAPPASGPAGPGVPGDVPPLPALLRGRETRRHERPVDPRMITAEISKLGTEGAWQDALQVVESFRASQGQVNIFHYNAALAACGRADQLSVALAYSQEMRAGRVALDAYSYGSLMRAAAGEGDGATALALLEEMQTEGIAANAVVCSAAVTALVRSGDWHRALELFQVTRERGEVVDAALLTAALAACGAGGLWEEALQLLKDVPEKQCADVQTWNAAIAACASAGRWQEALWLLEEEMTAEPDLYSYNSAITACEDRHWERALHLVMCRMGERQLQPDSVSFTAAIGTAREEHDIALSLLHEMFIRGVPRTARTYAALIATAGQHWAQALALLKYSKQEGIEATTQLCGSTLRACAAGRQWALAVGLLEEMQGQKVAVNNEACHAAISSCIVAWNNEDPGHWREALAMTGALRRAALQPDTATYVALISACSCCSRWQEALAIHTEAHLEATSEVQTMCTNALITAFGRGTEWRRALEAFEAATLRQRWPTVVTCNALISAFAEGSQWSMALQVLRSLPERSLTPTVVTMNAALHALAGGSHYAAAQSLLGRMPAFQLQPDCWSFTAVMTACTKATCWEATCELLTEMERKQINPDIYSINNMMSALAASPRWEEALVLLKNMPRLELAPDVLSYGAVLAARMQAVVGEANLAVLRGAVAPEKLCGQAVKAADKDSTHALRLLRTRNQRPDPRPLGSRRESVTRSAYQTHQRMLTASPRRASRDLRDLWRLPLAVQKLQDQEQLCGTAMASLHLSALRYGRDERWLQAARLNGEKGALESWNASSNRWNVRLRSGEVKAIRPENLEEVAGGYGSQKAPTSTAESLQDDPPLLEIWSRHRDNSERAKAAKKLLGGIDAPLQKLDLTVPPELLEQAKRSRAGGLAGGTEAQVAQSQVQDERIALDDLVGRVKDQKHATTSQILHSRWIRGNRGVSVSVCFASVFAFLHSAASVRCGAVVVVPRTTVLIGGEPMPQAAGSSSRSLGRKQTAIREALPRRRRNDEERIPEPAPEKEARPRRSKWDDRGDGNSPSTQTQTGLPDWLKDLEGPLSGKPVPQIVVPGPTTSRAQLPNLLGQRHKTMMLKAVQIRVLLGRGGETIKSICEKANAEIKVDHDRIADEGEVTIVGEIEKAEVLIRETLAAKGCPLPEDEANQPDETDLVVPPDVVGLFIGKGGEHVKAIREACGGNLFIGVIPPAQGNGPHKIQIIGDQREKAKAMVRQRLKELVDTDDKKIRPAEIPVVSASRQSFGLGPGLGPPLRPGVSAPRVPMPGPLPLTVPMRPITPMVPLNPVSHVAASPMVSPVLASPFGAPTRPVVRPRAQTPTPSATNLPNVPNLGLDNIPPAQRLLAAHARPASENLMPDVASWGAFGAGPEPFQGLAELEAEEAEEENPWLGIVPECELPT